MIVGMPGCGKSLTEKTTASLFNLPLLRLDVGSLMGKYVGSGGAGSEVATRLFGYSLTWMQDKTGTVFVLATANDISALPPELLRKGRFDEIFYVTFPNASERENIFTIHLKNARKPIRLM